MTEFTVKPKKVHLTARLIFITGFDVMICFFAIPALLEEGKYIGVAFSAFFFLLLSWELLTGLFLKPVSANIKANEITVNYLTHSISLNTDLIASYSETVFYTRMFNYDGILFYLKDGRKLELSELNIKTMQPVCAYLKEQSVFPYLGTERSHMSCFPFKYKYRLESKDCITPIKFGIIDSAITK